MALNKDEPHVLALTKKTRVELKTLVGEKIPDNLQKRIKAVDVRDSFEAVIDSTVNLIEENLDLRAYSEHFFQLSDCTYDSGTQIYTYTLAHEAVNPDDDSTLVIDGMDCLFEVDYMIVGNLLTFTIDNDIEDTELLEMLVKYRYFL